MKEKDVYVNICFTSATELKTIDRMRDFTKWQTSPNETLSSDFTE